jgi:uncharacterized protein
MAKREIKRYLSEIAFSERFGRQMRFIAGPRQSGKTSLAREFLHEQDCDAFYYDWDNRETRARYRNEQAFFTSDALRLGRKTPYWLCFDEIHKYRNWKNILKDFFDGHERDARFIVTGSARLESFRRSGDSLAGRYFLFHLNPLMLGEIIGTELSGILPDADASSFIEKAIKGKKCRQDELESLLGSGPFPEPFLANDNLFSKKWRESYIERIVREDLRDLTQIHHLEKVIDLIYLLPDKISSPLSLNSLKEDLDLNFNTVKSYINYLNLCYVLFDVPPFTRKKTRLVKKERKYYFYDFTNIANEGARFENLIALELKARIDLWNDATADNFGLFFVRTREGFETDFLIVRNGVPWLLFESKLTGKDIERHHFRHSELLGSIPIVQVVREPDILKVIGEKAYVVSAGLFFS